MKHFYLFLVAAFAALATGGCGNSSTSSNKLVDSLKTVVERQQAQIKALTDTIDMLKFPADQRYARAMEAFAGDNLDEAEKRFKEIKHLFPLSDEAAQCDEQLQKIVAKRQEIAAEQERIKALGFKALEPVANVTVGGVAVSFSGFSVGKEFIHDTYYTYGSSQWYYNTADKNNKFITCSMSATSSNDDPKLPTLALYSINGDKLKLEGTFRIEFARWDDLGSYLGNEPDLHNDFAKVNTVSFKLGCEAAEEIFAKPYMVVVKLSNTQTRDYERFRNPPYWYSGDAGYPASLTIDDFDSKYKAVKIANL